MLISAGHSSAMVLDDYSADELQVHYEAALRLRADEEARRATTFRVAANAKKKDFSKYIRRLAETGKRIDRELGRTIEVGKFFSDLDQMLDKKRGR